MIQTTEVEWWDAADKSEIPLREILDEKTCSRKYMVKTISYGKIIKEDDWGIVLLNHISEDDECEITTIPSSWIIKKVTYPEEKK